MSLVSCRPLVDLSGLTLLQTRLEELLDESNRELEEANQANSCLRETIDGYLERGQYSSDMPPFCAACPYFFKENLLSVYHSSVPPTRNIEIMHETLFFCFITGTHKCKLTY